MANNPSCLLDTSTFLWILDDNKRLTKKARNALFAEGIVRYLSYVSFIEICIKYSLNKLPLPISPYEIVVTECEARNITLLPLDMKSISLLENLPQHHKDPFDRLLVCQAITHGLTLITPDKNLRKYKVKTLW